MKYTTNYGLKKPGYEGVVDIQNLDSNADKIDQKLKENADAITSHSAETPKKTTQDINYYVSTTGSDTTGDGTSANPFRTIQFAINKLPQIINHNAIINIADGNYNENVQIENLFAGYTKRLIISGNITSIGNVKIIGMLINNCSNLTIQGLEFTGYTNNLFGQNDSLVIASSEVIIMDCKNVFSDLNCNAIDTTNSTIQVANVEVSNKQTAFIARSGSTVALGSKYSGGNTGIGNTTLMYAEEGGVIAKCNMGTITATTMEVTQYGGVIR